MWMFKFISCECKLCLCYNLFRFYWCVDYYKKKFFAFHKTVKFWVVMCLINQTLSTNLFLFLQILSGMWFKSNMLRSISVWYTQWRGNLLTSNVYIVVSAFFLFGVLFCFCFIFVGGGGMEVESTLLSGWFLLRNHVGSFFLSSTDFFFFCLSFCLVIYLIIWRSFPVLEEFESEETMIFGMGNDLHWH